MMLLGFKKPYTFLLVTLLVLSGCVTQPPQDPRNQSAVRARAKAHTDLGAAYFQQKKYDIALEEFTLAANIDPSFGFAFNGLGLVNAALKQDEDADRYFKRAIDLEPSNSEAHNNYGNFLCSRGRYQASIDEYLMAVKNPLYGTPAAAYTNAGICANRGGMDVKASEYLQQALKIEPLSPTAAHELALIQFKQNNAAGAYATLSPALEMRQTPKVLYLGIKLSQVLGKTAEARVYQKALFRNYPNSEQARALKKAMQLDQ